MADMQRINYPFSAIVGQPQMKTALLLCAVDPSLGGVLIRGDKGTAKSTAGRALADVLPFIERVTGCGFNCAPGQASEHCEACKAAAAISTAAPVPFVTLPLGATEDRVIGTLDIQRALKGDDRTFMPGLLAAAHRGVLYVDEVNLLPDHLVDVLLDVAAMGVNSVQREGLSVTHAARFTLIGTMNPEEGDLRPQLLDRFGLMVDVVAPREKHLRAEVVRRRIAFEADPAAYAAAWHAPQQALHLQVQTAQHTLQQVRLGDDLLQLISHLCCEFEVASLRADIGMHKAARALAALDARLHVTPDDVSTAAELVLPHRRRRKPFEQPGLDRERLDELMQQSQAAQASQSSQGSQESRESQGSQAPTQSPDADSAPADRSDGDESGQPENGDGAPHEAPATTEIFGAADSGPAPRITVDAAVVGTVAGRRSRTQDASRGSVVRAVADVNPSSLAVCATLRSAVMRNPAQLDVTTADLHQQVRIGKTANLILLVVDASGSMAAQQRMEAVKGAVVALLTDAYQRRDEVAVIGFRGDEAQLLLAPTRSVERARHSLETLQTGGRTPLAHALQLALSTVAQVGSLRMPPLLVLLTDGKANVAIVADGDPWQEALGLAGTLAGQGVAALVLDTESGYLRLGRAAQLAQALGAECLTLDQISAETITMTIRSQQHARKRTAS